jgi:3-hydroxyisobutyrate dehydrogenase-like beta-hydroxyacid dehydrogenase
VAVEHRLGFVGLGTIGFPLCRNLAQAGVDVVAYDARPRPERVAALRTAGARVAETLGDVAGGRNVLMTVLPDSEAVEAVLLDPELLGRLAPGTICVETSSGYPAATVRIGRALAERGVTLIDAPICNGGVPGAYARETVLCVGGDVAAFEAVRPMLESITSALIHVGPLGAGQAVKIVNNSPAMAVQTVVAERLALGVAVGLDGDRLVDALRQCSASKVTFERAAATLLAPSRDDVHFQLYLGTKDMRYSTALAGELGSPHGATDAAHAVYEIAERVLGLGAESDAAPGQLLKRLGSRAAARREALTPAR